MKISDEMSPVPVGKFLTKDLIFNFDFCHGLETYNGGPFLLPILNCHTAVDFSPKLILRWTFALTGLA